MPSTTSAPLRISIDRGGTFTDCIATRQGGEDIVIKILSVDKKNYPDAPTEAIRRVLEIFHGKSIPRGTELDLSSVEWIRMGTTVATNALLERKGERTAFLVTKGFKDVLVIGNQSRPAMFDLSIRRPKVLYSDVFEVDERVVPETCADSDLRRLELSSPASLETILCTSGEKVQLIKALDMEATRQFLESVYAQGYRSIAVALMHSYMFPNHELQIKSLAEKIGFENISLSHEVSQRSKIVPRGNSTVVDAYLTPEIVRYLNQFTANFPCLERSETRIEFMQSDGGLVPSSELSGLRSILSGPAGGVVGYSRTCFDKKLQQPVIGFDMGGTSTDVSRFDGELDQIHESSTAGMPIHVPQLNVNTIAAGGGSILDWRNGLMSVGPESASSQPGPACYRKGGPLTVTDANLALGRLVPEHFPSVFGPDENMPLDRDIVLEKFQVLTTLINKESGQSLKWEEVAHGFLEVANQAMCGPIRSLTEARGHDVGKHRLASFGGAGGQHACAIAEILGIREVLIHKYSSILSSYGIGLADVVHDDERSCAKDLDSARDVIFRDLDSLAELAREHRSMVRFPDVEVRRFLDMRYDGSETVMTIPNDEGVDVRQAFIDVHHQQFGFTPVGRRIYVDIIRVRATGRYFHDTSSDSSTLRHGKFPGKGMINSNSTQNVYFAGLGWHQTPTYLFQSLRQGVEVQGPALIIDKTQTIVVSSSSTAMLDGDNLVLRVLPPPKPQLSAAVVDPVQLSIFRHRFYGVAEQMGQVLQKVSVSANIKERLDFSCAIFNPEGFLVATAPHVPAMIGSMAYAVQSQIELWQGKLKDGDVLLSNSPQYGGVHLPDFTVITPVFDAEGKDIVFWTASRGHHADVGGILPGSMPPTSKYLWEEGAVFDSFLLVRDGKFADAELERILCVEPAKYPGSSGSRRFRDNVTDVKAQVAANQCGIRLVRMLVQEYTMSVVQTYMRAIQDSAELAIRNLFKGLSVKFQGQPIEAVDYMDDGTPIRLKITITQDGAATFDFTGTGPQVYGNWNAPMAITHSSTLYALRCMVNTDIPLNHGCIKPIKLLIPDGSMLKPSFEAAVCAGNVLTSQRIVDVIFKALQVCAASQGCMNNFTFGIDGEGGFGYYETIAGGSGAGPSWHGTSGVHTNMTNTRITDAESLERRYPVVLREFGLRPHSGGAGQFCGGDGVIRDVEFRMAMSASMLSERRSMGPYGMKNGEEGRRGVNTWVKTNGARISIGGKNSVQVQPGDRLVIETPGGGGYGQPS